MRKYWGVLIIYAILFAFIVATIYEFKKITSVAKENKKEVPAQKK